VADQPLVDAASLAQLLRGFDNDNRLVASSYNDTLGVPAVIGAEYFGELMKLEGDQGAGKWLRARRANVTQVPVPTASLDIDTPVDAHAFASGLARPKH
jgi:molybdenum cofactor cytidylyltransferase